MELPDLHYILISKQLTIEKRRLFMNFVLFVITVIGALYAFYKFMIEPEESSPSSYNDYEYIVIRKRR